MSTKPVIVISLTLVLGTASAAIAATKHPIHQQHQLTVERQVAAAADQSYGSARRAPSEPAYMRIQDEGLYESFGF